MKADVTEVAKCRYKIAIEVTKDEVKKEYDEMLNTLRSRVAIKGFRPGHTPNRVLMRRYGDDISKDVTSKLFQDTFTDALKGEDLAPLGEPDIDITTLAAPLGEAFTYTTEIDVRPKFDIPEYKGLKLIEEIEKVTDDKLNENLEQIRKGFAESKETTESFKKGDSITADLKMSEGENKIMEREDFRIPPEATYLMGVEVKDLQEQLEGLKAGEEKSFNLDVPESFYQKDAAGKNVDIKMTVKKIEESILPELSDELAKKVGFDTLEKLQEKVRESLENEKKQAARTETAKKVLDELMEKVEMELPEEYINKQTEARTAQARKAIEDAENDEAKAEAEKKLAEEEKEAHEEAVKMTRRSALLDAIADEEKIEVSQDDIMIYIQGMAKQYGMPAEQMMKMVQSQGSMLYIVQDVREGKVIEFIINNAEIEEKTV